MDQTKKLNAIIILLAVVVGLELFNGVLNHAKNLQGNIYGAVAPQTPNISTIPENQSGPHINNISPQELYVGGIIRIQGTRFTPSKNTLYFCLTTDKTCTGEYSGIMGNVSANQGLISFLLPSNLGPNQGDGSDNVLRKPMPHGLTQGKYNFYIVNEFGQTNIVPISISTKDNNNTLKFGKSTEFKLGAQKIFQDGQYSLTFESVPSDNRCVGECANAPKREAVVRLLLTAIPPSNSCTGGPTSDCAQPMAPEPISIVLRTPADGTIVKSGPYVFTLNKLVPKTAPKDPAEYMATVTVTKGQ